MSIDFQPPKQSFSHRSRKWRLPLILLAGLLLLGAVFLLNRPAVTPTEARTAPTVEISAPPVPQVKHEVIADQIRNGDTITSLLGDYLSPGEILDLGKRSRKVFPLSKICSGQPYKLCLADGSFERFEYDIDRNEQLIITRQADQFSIDRKPIDYQVQVDHLRGVISSSLFEAVSEIGEEPELALGLADIFAWDVDFILDIRKGDSFQVLVEKRFRDGKPAGYGRILAAEFSNRGHDYKAFLFADGDKRPSYYDENGKSVRKAFLKAPLKFSRISSGFTFRRFHPIRKTWRAHPAIDYAAPIGTPIKAVGDGVISRKGYTRGNGNFIEIRHNSTYKTLYLHMSKFGRGIRKGRQVTQGQIIGYVGQTGLATGPHLCFRMYRNGRPVNPTKIKAPASAPVSKQHRTEFEAMIQPLLAQLEGGSTVPSLRAENRPASNIKTVSN
ncbi:peptidase M23 [Geothermobacter hydrogeniphilus]|uniref:Peptidase M23 n=1 Tax=Geothermobacter hydrogeniphilus TaxID=1969733 RepID=A0A2K2HC24_9BACT|nr:peptidoglycan DD-metalloendopeptidase family protein [Geothermobacter hydrogeniphilus]PNU20783.1 peptidase M23 [Geothermobacter hydrogeniphilus]